MDEINMDEINNEIIKALEEKVRLLQDYSNVQNSIDPRWYVVFCNPNTSIKVCDSEEEANDEAEKLSILKENIGRTVYILGMSIVLITTVHTKEI